MFFTMSQSNKIRLLIADDHGVVRLGLMGLISFEEGLEVVAQATDGKEAIDLYQKHRPDIVIMDVRMPAVDGLDAVGAIRALDPASKLILITAYGAEEDMDRALRLGVDGYLFKSTLETDLIPAIRSVAAGHKYIPTSVAEQLIRRMSRVKISDREIEVVRELGRGKTNKEIAGLLGVSEETVKRHVTNILPKLGVRHRTEAALLAVQRGLVRLKDSLG